MLVLAILLLHMAVAAGLVAALNEISLRRWRKAAAAHWTERARLLWPARVLSGLNVLFVPVSVVAAYGAFPFWGETPLTPALLAALMGGIAGAYPLSRSIFPQVTLSQWAHGVGAVLIVRFGALALYVAAACLMPAEVGWRMAAVGLGFAGAYLLLVGWLIVPILRWLRMVRPASDRLLRIVAAESARQHIAVKRTSELESVVVNALAVPQTRELVFTTGMLDALNDEEVAAICAHELGHLGEPKLAIAARLGAALIILPLVFLRPLITAFGLWGLAGAFIAMAVMKNMVQRFLRRMEARADDIAHSQAPDEELYGRTLEKAYRLNQLPAVLGKNRVAHPDLYDRMLATGVQPDYPRPRPPARTTVVGALVFVMVCGSCALFAAKRQDVFLDDFLQDLDSWETNAEDDDSFDEYEP